MVWLGVFILGYVAFQVVGTNLLNRGVQEQARSTFQAALPGRVEALPPETVVTPDQQDSPTPESVVLHPETAGAQGDPIAVIRIPKISVDDVVFEGTTPTILRNGPGHIVGTAMPGQPGNAVISGHRTTHGAPFFSLDKLAPGDRIEVDTALGTHVYQVTELIVVRPTDVWVTNPKHGAWLTLTTCNPIGSARERLVVFAELTEGVNYAYAQADLVRGQAG